MDVGLGPSVPWLYNLRPGTWEPICRAQSLQEGLRMSLCNRLVSRQ